MLVQGSLGRIALAGVALFLLISAAGAATPLEELSAVASLPPLDLAKLKQGEIVVERGPVGDFPRGVHLQACYFVHAPMSEVGHTLLHWDPVQKKDPEVRMYREYAFPGTSTDFKSLQLEPAIDDEKWLLEQSAKAAREGAAGDLHLTQSELSLLREKEGKPSEAWREILRRRSTALARGGIKGVPPYTADGAISPGSEFRGLLTLAPKVAQHFRALTSAQPATAGGKPPSESVAFWEAAKVRDHTTLQLGLFAAQKGADSWQLMDCIYYPSDTYFMALDFFQLWPVEGGTLVWQVGFVSAPFRSYLGGVDRFVAGKLMTEETIETIKAFRTDLEKRR